MLRTLLLSRFRAEPIQLTEDSPLFEERQAACGRCSGNLGLLLRFNTSRRLAYYAIVGEGRDCFFVVHVPVGNAVASCMIDGKVKKHLAGIC